MPVLSTHSTLAGSPFLSSNNYSSSSTTSLTPSRYLNSGTTTASSIGGLGISTLNSYRTNINSSHRTSIPFSYRQLGNCGNDTTGIGSSGKNTNNTITTNSNSHNRFGVSNISTRNTRTTSIDLGKPPTGSRLRSESRVCDLSLDKTYSSYYTVPSSVSSSTLSTCTPSSRKSDLTSTPPQSSYQNTKRQSSTYSLATSTADLYEKYSVANYTPKSELSRSRSLSEATTPKLVTGGASISSTTSIVDKHSRYHRSTSKDRGIDTSNSNNSTSAIIDQVKNAGSVPCASPILLTNHTTSYLSNNINNNNNNNHSIINNNNNNPSESSIIAVTNHKAITNKSCIETVGNTINCILAPRSSCSAALAGRKISTIDNSSSNVFRRTTTVNAKDRNNSTHSTSGNNNTSTTPTTTTIGNKNNKTLITNGSANGAVNMVSNKNKLNTSNATIAEKRQDILKRAAITKKADNNFLVPEIELVKNQLANLDRNKEIKSSKTTTTTTVLCKHQTTIKTKQPLVHQTKLPNTAITTISAIKDDLNNNNTMNCMDKHSLSADLLLDDIKYIDSDECVEHQRKHQPLSAINKPSATASTISSTSAFYVNDNNGGGGATATVGASLPIAMRKTTINTDTNIVNPKSCHQNSIQINISKSSPYKSVITTSTSSYLEQQQQQQQLPTDHDVINGTSSNNTAIITAPANGFVKSNNQSSFSNVDDSNESIDSPVELIAATIGKQQKFSEINVRNTSIRNGLPPTPSTSSSSSSSGAATLRYWERDFRPSISSSSRNYNCSDIVDSSPLPATKSLASSSISSRSSSDESEGLCGLRNIGNTCFMNSVIQCLSHTNDLCQYLRTKNDYRSVTKDQRILTEFAKLLREMWASNTRSVTPLELKSAFSSKHRMYSGYAQQDAQEFLRFFLDSLHSACNVGQKGEQLTFDDNLPDNKKAELTWEWYTKVENSVIKDLFVGQLKSSLKCTVCGHTSVTFDPFWDLSVPLPSLSRCKLESCLDLFIKEEILDGDEMPTCSKCKTRRKSTKSFTIQRFPKYLVIHLKRFSETRWSKLSNVVEFPTGEKELNMSPYAADSSQQRSVNYSLYGISNHMGSTAGGHYVALCKHSTTRKWHEFNDNIVNDTSENSLVSSSAYLLFYERA